MAEDGFEEAEGGSGLPAFLRDPFGIPRRRWGWMILGVLVGLAATAAATQYRTPNFIAHATILVTSQQIPKEFVRSTVTEDPFSRLNAMVGTVLSRQRLLELIEEYDLYTDARAQVSIEQVVGTMRGAIQVTPRRNVGAQSERETAKMFEVAYRNIDPNIAAAVANRLAALFVEGGLQSRMDHAIGISQFMRKELERTDVALREVGHEISVFKNANRGHLPDDLESNLRRLERLQEQRSSLAVQVAETETRSSVIASQKPDKTLVQSGPEVRLIELQKRYDLEIAVHTEEHPTVIALKRQMEDLERSVAENPSQEVVQVDSERSTALASARAEIQLLKQEQLKTEETIKQIDQLVRLTPKTGEELAALEERAGVLRTKYLEFLRKVSEAEMAQTLEAAQYGARVSIVDRAQPPSAPDFSPRKIALLGLAVSLVLGLVLGVGIEFLDPVVVDRAQVESMTGLPVLGSVPRLG